MTHPFDMLANHFAELVAGRLGTSAGRPGRKPAKAAQAPKAVKTRSSANARRSKSMTGRKLDMTCRVAGCKNRSGGPRWGFICEAHRSKLSQKAQQAAREAYKAA